jgi:hypothetical protein
VINWADGSCYMGEWYYEQVCITIIDTIMLHMYTNDAYYVHYLIKVKGKGVYVTPLRDVYKGEMSSGQFHGYGELLYANGSRYLGHFQAGRCHMSLS